MERGNNIDKNGEEVFPNGGSENGKAVHDVPHGIREVRGILEHNRMLIQEIKQNYEAREASGSRHYLTLMLEFNNNITHLMELYSNLSLSLSLSEGSPTDADTDGDGGTHTEATKEA